ncbi:hypothetical protein SprV_0100511000 [Sparganum proliferum]
MPAPSVFPSAGLADDAAVVTIARLSDLGYSTAACVPPTDSAKYEFLYFRSPRMLFCSLSCVRRAWSTAASFCLQDWNTSLTAGGIHSPEPSRQLSVQDYDPDSPFRQLLAYTPASPVTASITLLHHLTLFITSVPPALLCFLGPPYRTGTY